MINKTYTTRAANSRPMFRKPASLLLIAILLLTLTLFSACSGGADESELKVTDCGVIVKDENWFTYYVVVENLTDKPLDGVLIEMTAYDENGEQIHMKNLSSQPTIVQMHEGEVQMGYVPPGGKALYASEVNITTEYAEYEAIPARMEVSIQSASWAKEDKKDRLEVVDYAETGSFYDTELSYWDPATEEAVYDGVETREEVSITLKNIGDQDFVSTDDYNYDIGAVLRDDAGNVVGVSIGFLGMDDKSPMEVSIAAGEEVCFNMSSITYVPHDNIEFYIFYYDFRA